MAITLNGTSGITTPGVTNSGAETIATTLSVTGAATMASTLTVTGAIKGSGLTDTLYPLVSGTAVASTSGTSIDFTDIPSWVTRITVMFSGVSTNGTSAMIVQLGDSGGIETTGYVSTAEFVEDNAGGTAFTTGFAINNVGVAAATYSGLATITTLGSNIWVYQSMVNNASTSLLIGAGNKTLSGTLTQVRITTVGGANTFDAGSINILYE